MPDVKTSLACEAKNLTSLSLSSLSVLSAGMIMLSAVAWSTSGASACTKLPFYSKGGEKNGSRNQKRDAISFALPNVLVRSPQMICIPNVRKQTRIKSSPQKALKNEKKTLLAVPLIQRCLCIVFNPETQRFRYSLHNSQVSPKIIYLKLFFGSKYPKKHFI